MSIAISSQGTSPDSSIDEHFGRCSYFVIFNPEDNKFTHVPNPGKQASGGAGALAANVLAENKVGLVFSVEYGPKAINALEAMGIDFRKIEDKTLTIRQITDLYLKETKS